MLSVAKRKATHKKDNRDGRRDKKTSGEGSIFINMRLKKIKKGLS